MTFFKNSLINNCKISKGQTFDVKKFICQFYSPCFCFYSSLERGPAEKTNIDPKYILLKEITSFGNRSCEVMSSPFWLFKNFSSVFDEIIFTYCAQYIDFFLEFICSKDYGFGWVTNLPMGKSSIFWTFYTTQPITLKLYRKKEDIILSKSEKKFLNFKRRISQVRVSL